MIFKLFFLDLMAFSTQINVRPKTFSSISILVSTLLGKWSLFIHLPCKFNLCCRTVSQLYLSCILEEMAVQCASGIFPWRFTWQLTTARTASSATSVSSSSPPKVKWWLTFKSSTLSAGTPGSGAVAFLSLQTCLQTL